MFLPDNLTPLPVLLRDGMQADAGEEVFDDFVRADDVRKVLLGEPGEVALEGLPAVDLDSFAGRSDVSCPTAARWTGDPGLALAVPCRMQDPVRMHPAFEALPPARRAAPPVPRMEEDCEASFGRAKMSDRWWVIGMGLAAAAILFSGAAVDFISREAVRRSRAGVESAPHAILSVPVERGPSEEQRSEEIAATLSLDEKP